jgi:hypothetical protein
MSSSIVPWTELFIAMFPISGREFLSEVAQRANRRLRNTQGRSGVKNTYEAAER